MVHEVQAPARGVVRPGRVREPPEAPSGVRHPDPHRAWTGYAVIKYGFILLITIVALYFIARYLIPLFD